MPRLFFAGDIACVKYSSFSIDKGLQKVIQEADFSICNLEAPVSDQKNKITKAGPCISQSSETIKILKDAGFNIMGLANNHIYDFGEEGLMNTIKRIEENGLMYLGAGFGIENIYKTTVLEEDGIKIGLIFCSEAQYGAFLDEKDEAGYAWINHTLIKKNLFELKKECDYIIMNCHAGAENFDVPLPEWRAIYKEFCDLGVDVIVGHHPHVVQGIEKYNNSLIFYSLGNFFFDFDSVNTSGMSVLLDLDKSKLDYDIIFHNRIDNLLEKIDYKGNVLAELNNKLIDNYEEYVNEYCLSRYSLYKSYFEYSFSPVMSFRGIIKMTKNFIKKIIKRDILNEKALIYHNLAIETHRFIILRALRLHKW